MDLIDQAGIHKDDKWIGHGSRFIHPTPTYSSPLSVSLPLPLSLLIPLLPRQRHVLFSYWCVTRHESLMFTWNVQELTADDFIHRMGNGLGIYLPAREEAS